MCVPNNFNHFKSGWPKKILVYVNGISQILIKKKICHFPELRIYQKLFILSNLYQKICKKMCKKCDFEIGETYFLAGYFFP